MAEETKKVPIRYASAKMAVDVNIEYIIDYLCDIGPSFCRRCPSQCAYGKRYLKEYAPRIQEKQMYLLSVSPTRNSIPAFKCLHLFQAQAQKPGYRSLVLWMCRPSIRQSVPEMQKPLHNSVSVSLSTSETNTDVLSAIEALVSLGYKRKDAVDAVNGIDCTLPLETILSQVLKKFTF